VAATDSEAVGHCPAVWGFLTQGLVAGKPRRTGTITVFAEDGKLKAAVTDRETGLVAFVSARTGRELLGIVDTGLRTGELDWRPGKRYGRA
jgi:hypothetical protein